MLKSALTNKSIEKGRALESCRRTAGRVDAGQAAARFDRAIHEGGRTDLADKEQAEIVILNAYLPASASDDEIAAAVTAAIAETGATGPRTWGR